MAATSKPAAALAVADMIEKTNGFRPASACRDDAIWRAVADRAQGVRTLRPRLMP